MRLPRFPRKAALTTGEIHIIYAPTYHCWWKQRPEAPTPAQGLLPYPLARITLTEADGNVREFARSSIVWWHEKGVGRLIERRLEQLLESKWQHFVTGKSAEERHQDKLAETWREKSGD